MKLCKQCGEPERLNNDGICISCELDEKSTEMKDHPILYKPEMAQAAHDGLKTNTRRIVKNGVEWGTPEDLNDLSEYGLSQMRHCCPYGKIGDRLWVKEVHYSYGTWWRNGYTEKGHEKWAFEDQTSVGNPVLFPNNQPEKICKLKHKGLDIGYFKRNSLFMPKKHCRTWLKITNIKVERLQEISEQDAITEGIKPSEIAITNKTCFRILWDSINGKPRKDGTDISWKSNPWVWVIEFERIER